MSNVKELLDAPTEWYLETTSGSAARVLYYYPNTTAVLRPEASAEEQARAALASAKASRFVASKLATLVNISGTMAAPAKGQTLSGVTLAHAATTFMSDYEVPSAGDWSIHRGGAVLIENAEDATVEKCVFNQIGGNGVTVSKYARNVAIADNEMVRLHFFHFCSFLLRFCISFVCSLFFCLLNSGLRRVYEVRIGDSGILVVGDLKYDTPTPWDHSVDGAYPLGTRVTGNLIHELGLFTKQTAGFFQALAANTTVQGNIVLNGPRSGLNFNDAAFGGNDIRENLLANLVRETVDHGPYNSWDRNPYIWRTSLDDEASATTYTPAMSSVHHNFIFCSYGGIKGIDHDDGSGYYYDHDNFLPYCTGKMKGEAQTVRRNVYLFPRWTSCFKSMGGMLADSPMVFEDNSCVNESPQIYSSCSTDQTNQILANNTLFVSGAVVDPKTGVVEIPHFPCNNGNFTAWQASGQDVGSTVSGTIPSTATMVGWGKALLAIPN